MPLQPVEIVTDDAEVLGPERAGQGVPVRAGQDPVRVRVRRRIEIDQGDRGRRLFKLSY